MISRIRGSIALALVIWMLAPVARADVGPMPDRETFSMGYSRIETAIRKGLPVKWEASVMPETMMDIQEGAMSGLRAIFSDIDISGVLQCATGGNGWLEVSAMSNGQEFATFGQMRKDGRIGLNLNGMWFSVAEGTQAQAASMLSLDELAESLLSVNYDHLRKAEIPFVSPVVHYGKRLWELASPFADDNKNLRVSSGATGHGTSYSIDTAAARKILSQLVEDISADDFSLGIPGLGFSIGVDQEAVQGFIDRLSTLSRNIELAKPMTFNMAFGEGDVLSYAKGSGTLKESEGRTSVSYAYSCKMSSTRITRSYSVNFQPKQGDTLVLNYKTVTSSNKKSSGAQEYSLDAKGIFDGKPYIIKFNSEMLNKFGASDNQFLVEEISGTMTALVTYGDIVVLNIDLERNGNTRSSTSSKAISVEDRYDLNIQDARGTIFHGNIALALNTGEQTLESPDMKSTQYLENMDFLEIETLRDDLKAALIDTEMRLISASSDSAAKLFLNAF